MAANFEEWAADIETAHKHLEDARLILAHREKTADELTFKTLVTVR
jgi:hypothetical protein